MSWMGVFTLVLGFVILFSLHFSTTATAAFGATLVDTTPIGDVEAGSWEEGVEHITVASDEETAYAPIPHILFTSSPSAPSYTSAVSFRRAHVASPALRKRMFSPTDTVASNLWRSLVQYGNRSAPTEPQRARPTVVRPSSPAQDSLFGDNNNSSDASELPYLCVDIEEPEADSPRSSEDDSLLGTRFNRGLLSALLFDDSDSDDDSTIASSIESLRSQDDVCLPSQLARSSSRPALKLQTGSRFADVEPSSPSPVDSGYGSRPDTPFVDKDAQSGLSEDSSSTSSPNEEYSPIVFSQNPAAAASPEEAFLSLGYCLPGAKTTTSIIQGHIIPRIILTDEADRMVDLTYDDEELKRAVFAAEDLVDSPYGGLVPVVEVEVERVAPVVPVPAPTRVAANIKIKSIAAGAAVDRAFVSVAPSRVQITRSTATLVYNNRRRAPALALDCVGEEEEGEERVVDSVAGLAILEEEEEEVVAEEIVVEDVVVADVETAEGEEDGVKCLEVEVAVEALRKAEEDVKQSTLPTVQGEDTVGTKANCEVPCLDDHAPVSAVSMSFTSVPIARVVAEVRPKPIIDEDDDCEACGLFFTVPDANYHRMVNEPRQPAATPGIVFGLLKPTGVLTSTKNLNTAYHVALEGRGSRPIIAHCAFDCKRGFWTANGGSVGDFAPQDCPVHGGRGTCQVGAILNQRPIVPSFDTMSPAPDYASFVVEVIGSPYLSVLDEDSDEDELVLHRGEVIHAAERKNTIPRTGANYDEFMSGFMDDVDLTSSSSVDSYKNAPLGKLGGALKELRAAAMPEAVDHLKDGLGKTESVFRAALAAAPFKFGTVSEKLIYFKSGEEKANLARGKSASNELYTHMRQRSSISMKGKWSNMLSKFAR